MTIMIENPRHLPPESTHARWICDSADLKVDRRLPGISGFMRLCDEEEFVALAIESHLPFVDELVIVYNRCTDRTPEIVEAHAEQFPDKIRAYHYEPVVFSYGTTEYTSLPPHSPHSLVNYYNFALCQTTRTVAVKIDGDHVAIPATMCPLVETVRREPFRAYLGFGGLNLVAQDGEWFVNGNYPLTDWETGFFSVTDSTWHVFDPRWEVLEIGDLPRMRGAIAFYHLKALKRDRGYKNWNFSIDHAAEDPELEEVRQRWHNPRLISFEEYRRIEPMARTLPHPRALGIKLP